MRARNAGVHTFCNQLLFDNHLLTFRSGGNPVKYKAVLSVEEVSLHLNDRINCKEQCGAHKRRVLR